MSAGVLFDVDGTLVDTSYLHAVTWWEALRQHDHEVPMARIHRAIGMGSDRILDHLLGEDHDRAADDELRAAHASLYGQYWDRVRAQPEAADLLRACAARGLRVGLASSASPREMAVLRRALDADDVLGAASDAGDARSSKPDPDILAATLADLGLPADRVIFVGDTVWDVYAAGKLDIPCVALSCGGVSAAELREAGAIEVYAGPAELRDRLPHSAIGALRPDSH